jgi:aminomethyltransferase
MQGFEPQRPTGSCRRSGYTGEDGFEIGLPEADARELLVPSFWPTRAPCGSALPPATACGSKPGLCLHGNDITPDNDPASAGLMWAIPKDLRADGGFIGARRLLRSSPTAPSEKRVGLKPEGRQPVRSGAELFDADGKLIGRVTSGGFGPSAGHPVAMGYVSASLAKAGTRAFRRRARHQGARRRSFSSLHAASLPQRIISDDQDLFHRRP